jgi:hypothetical protein
MWTATLSAASKEWNVDKSLLDLVLSGVGALQAAGDVAKVANALGKSGDISAARNALNSVESFNRVDVANTSAQFAAAEKAKSIQDSSPSSNFIRLPKKTWSGIKGDEVTLELRANPNNLNVSGRSYEPTVVGSSAVVLGVKRGFCSVGVDPSSLVSVVLEEASATMMALDQVMSPVRFTPCRPTSTRWLTLRPAVLAGLRMQGHSPTPLISMVYRP